jgi:hypothetical protein
MQNMSDNELDNLFKEAAEGFVPPQDESAWKQMTSMLDQHAVKTDGFWNLKTIAALTVTGVISIMAVWFAATGDQEIISKTSKTNGSNNATPGVVQELKEQTHPSGGENLAPAESMEDKNSGVHAISKAELEGEAKNPATKGKVAQREMENTEPSDNQQLRMSKKTETVAIIPDQSVSQAVVPQAQRNAVHSTVEDKLVVAGDSAKIASKTETDSADRVSEVVDKKGKKANQGGVFGIKAVVSPDFSSVNFFSASKSGFNYGLLAGYSFNNRWSVYTGVISSKKLYSTNNIEGSYNWDNHDYPVKELDGDCRILDIPINVYYTFFPERSFSLRAGLGFSSYIMRKESYVYCLDVYGDDTYYEQHVNGKNNEWFKVMNLSIAVSKKLANRLSVEFEPFVKAPLAGVGEGKVSLVSMGAFLNLKYDLIIFK